MLNRWHRDWHHPWYRERLERWNVRVITPPTAEPVTLAQARLWCRVDAYPGDGSPTQNAHPDDDLISGLITAAREWIEAETGRALAPQVIETSRNTFPVYWDRQLIKLPFAPIRFIRSVSYRADDGTEIFLAADADYVVETYGYVPHVIPAAGVTWPSVTSYPNAVRVIYEAGYDIGGESPTVAPPIPESLRTSMKMLIAYWYAQREAVLDVTGRAILDEVPLGPRVLVRPYSLNLGVV